VSVVDYRADGAPIEPKVKAFLRYLPSAEGQAVIAREGSYEPLSGDNARRQSRRLD
jgi:ABC-type Fe3+ transport system substrate-binding protein